MPDSHPNPSELLETVLEPLLEDFQYWFTRAQTLLQSERITLLSLEEQEKLLERVKKSQQEVSTAQLLFKTLGKQAGIDTNVLVPWHQLVAECWQVSRRWRAYKKDKG
ncbi:conserved hypothetical protein [Rippkaea orientalis PCC 8801]|uniref:DUF2605 domain-containing protein n=1 Tax=Rippkaea orientalis (strain PCC 8801 / RF-1) TaxID=41431 RepID=B7K1T6_RIPO1|nr:DUF2605 domain-containing protein [Rippkaea orientalis]ACK64243.1 conserved hypothetical protein [Rippkaea orientalis PCC 8801]